MNERSECNGMNATNGMNVVNGMNENEVKRNDAISSTTEIITLWVRLIPKRIDLLQVRLQIKPPVTFKHPRWNNYPQKKRKSNRRKRNASNGT